MGMDAVLFESQLLSIAVIQEILPIGPQSALTGPPLNFIGLPVYTQFGHFKNF